MRIPPLAFYLLLASAFQSLAQTKNFREQTFSEILSIIEHPFELLGKTDSTIVSAGRPSTIVGGDEWTVEVVDTPGTNEMEASKAMVIGTGRAAIMLIVSQQTGLVHNLTYLPLPRAKVKGVDIIKYLEGKYKFDDDVCIFKNDNGYIGIGIMKGGFNLMAFEEDGKKLKFK